PSFAAAAGQPDRAAALARAAQVAARRPRLVARQVVVRAAAQLTTGQAPAQLALGSSSSLLEQLLMEFLQLRRPAAHTGTTTRGPDRWLRHDISGTLPQLKGVDYRNAFAVWQAAHVIL